jgi:hypothetical protein
MKLSSLSDLIKGRKYVSKPIDIWVSGQEWTLIKRGSTPQSMDDKWIIFYRHGFLHFCRSWGKRHVIFKTRPKRVGSKFHFSVVHCRRGIEPHYKLYPDFDETSSVKTLIEHRTKTPGDEPWIGWDPRYPKDPKFLNPDFSKRKII